MSGESAVVDPLGPGHHLAVGDGHHVWWAHGGDPAGVPVLIVHGGPGGRSRAETVAWWDGLPVRWICLDQRGCGRSTPRGGTRANTVGHLVRDMEALRTHLGLPRWAIAAGSWGALVALAYAAEHRERVAGLFLRSAFLGSRGELDHYLAAWPDWLGEAGAAWRGRADGLAEVYGAGLLPAAAEDDATGRAEARLGLLAQAYDAAQSPAGGVVASGARWVPPTEAAPTWEGEAQADWRVHAHFARSSWTLGHDAWVWAEAVLPALDGPVALLHGDRDAVCPVSTLHRLAALRPDADVTVVSGGGHRLAADPMRAALRSAAQRWAAVLPARGSDAGHVQEVR